MWRRVSTQLLLITILALGIRLIWGLTQLSQDVLNVDEGDYALYRIGAEHILSEGDLTNSLFLVRPPAFALVVAFFNLNNAAIIIFNAILGALLTPLTYILARQLKLSHVVALLAAGVVSVDPLTVQYTAFLGPEALAFVGALAMMVCLLAVVEIRSTAWALGAGAGAAAMFLLSVYSRPSIYLVWVGLVIWLLFVNWRRWPALLLFVILSLAGMQVWVDHNARVFDNPTFSSISAYTMTYYHAVAVVNQATEMSIPEIELDIARRVEEKLGRDPALVDENSKHGYLAASPEIEAALQAVSFEIFREYPLTFIATFPIGFIRLYHLAPSVPPFSELLKIQNYPLVVWNWLVLLLGVLGVIQAARTQRWLLFWSVLLLFGYFTAGTLLSKSAGLSGRERTIIFPYMAIACAYGASVLWSGLRKRLQRRGQPVAPPAKPDAPPPAAMALSTFPGV
jgi:hypothetical protein